MLRSFFLTIVWVLILPASLFAQLSITYPKSRAVFQRDNSNKADFFIAGNYSGCIDRIEAKLIPRQEGQGTPTDWFTIQENPTGGVFQGKINLAGGWYDLLVRGMSNNTVLYQNVVERVGVGEVFLVVGQSNATGGDGVPNGPSASDDRVNSVNFQNIINGQIPTYSATQLPIPEFVHLQDHIKPAPFGNYAWFWGKFGDMIVERENVPVLIFNSGWTGTGAFNWEQTINPLATSTSAYGYTFPQGMPFGHLRLALNYYIAQQGCRAILCMQGETDNHTSSTRENHRNDLRKIIQASRDLSGKSQLAWVMSRTSRNVVQSQERNWQPVIDAQNDIIGLPVSIPGISMENVFPGPETDAYFGPQYRYDGVHFTGEGLTLLADIWKNSLPSAFFTSTSTPQLATPPPAITVTCEGQNSISLTAAAGWTNYQWVDNTGHTILHTGQQWNVDAGNYLLKTNDGLGNTVFSSKVEVPNLPAVTVSANSNSPVANRSSMQLLAVSESACAYEWSGPSGFSSTLASPTLPSVNPGNEGEYFVTVTNTLGCRAQGSVMVTVTSLLQSAKSGNWNDPNTWTCNCIPTSGTDVVLNAGHSIVVESATINAKSIHFNGGFLQFSINGSLVSESLD